MCNFLSGTCKMKVKLDIVNVTNLFQMQTNILASEERPVGFSPTSTTIGRFFRAAASFRARLMCNLSLEKVRLLVKCGFYTQLYGTPNDPALVTLITAMSLFWLSVVVWLSMFLFEILPKTCTVKLSPRNTFKPGRQALECSCSSSEKNIRFFIFKIYLRFFQLHAAPDALLFLCLILLRREFEVNRHRHEAVPSQLLSGKFCSNFF